MPRPRKTQPVETAYQRRIRRYLEQHPGATRQQARGKKSGEFSERVERYRKRHPGASKQEAAGKTGQAAMLRYLRPGTLVICDLRTVKVEEKGGRRRWRSIPKLLIPEDVNRPEREFVLRGPGGHGYDEAMLRRLIDREVDRGAVFSAAPSLDQRRLLDY